MTWAKAITKVSRATEKTTSHFQAGTVVANDVMDPASFLHCAGVPDFIWCRAWAIALLRNAARSRAF
jgi:hypothetical protein